jgi:hypothetical protein
VERIKKNTCISIRGRIFALMQTLTLGLQSKEKIKIKIKNETKRNGLTCQGITKPKEFGTHFQSKGS